jgi:7-carboxy-7-deazaguanine synthase
MSESIVLAEEGFFYTIQGEGKYIGYPTTFVRLSMCNLRCAWENPDGSITKCDTPHTSFEPEKVKYDVSTLAAQIHNEKAHHICISGGEPYFQKSVTSLINQLHDMGHFVSLETNGTIYRESRADFISLSPKLGSSSADPTLGKRHDKNRINYDALEQFILNHDYQFKFVLNSDEDYKEIQDIRLNLLDRTGIDINDKIWLMPQGITTEQFDAKLLDMAEICKKNGWHLTDRLHIRIWGQKKGV